MLVYESCTYMYIACTFDCGARACTVSCHVPVCMCAHFILQQQEYDLVLEDQITFVMTETVAGNRSDMVSGTLVLV